MASESAKSASAPMQPTTCMRTVSAACIPVVCVVSRLHPALHLLTPCAGHEQVSPGVMWQQYPCPTNPRILSSTSTLQRWQARRRDDQSLTETEMAAHIPLESTGAAGKIPKCQETISLSVRRRGRATYRGREHTFSPPVTAICIGSEAGRDARCTAPRKGGIPGRLEMRS